MMLAVGAKTVWRAGRFDPEDVLRLDREGARHHLGRPRQHGAARALPPEHRPVRPLEHPESRAGRSADEPGAARADEGGRPERRQGPRHRLRPERVGRHGGDVDGRGAGGTPHVGGPRAADPRGRDPRPRRRGAPGRAGGRDLRPQPLPDARVLAEPGGHRRGHRARALARDGRHRPHRGRPPLRQLARPRHDPARRREHPPDRDRATPRRPTRRSPRPPSWASTTRSSARR